MVKCVCVCEMQREIEERHNERGEGRAAQEAKKESPGWRWRKLETQKAGGGSP